MSFRKVVPLALLCALAGCGGLAPGQSLPVGVTCSVAGDCGTGPYLCIKQDFPNGYCSRSCNSDSDCPSGSVCPTSGKGDGDCMQTCAGDADCRLTEGYFCDKTHAGSLSSFCAPGPTQGI